MSGSAGAQVLFMRPRVVKFCTMGVSVSMMSGTFSPGLPAASKFIHFAPDSASWTYSLSATRLLALLEECSPDASDT